MTSSKTLALIMALLVATSGIAGTTSGIRGQVVDPAGQVVADAKVELVHAEFGTTVTLSSDEKGQFIRTGLQPGEWSVRVAKDGFIEWSSQERLRLGNVLQRKVELTPASAAVDPASPAEPSFSIDGQAVSPETAERYQAAQQAVTSGQMSQAQPILEALIAEAPAMPDPYFSLAQLLRPTDPKRAVELLEKGLALDRQRVNGWIALGEMKSDAADHDGAVAAFVAATAAAPDAPAAYRKLGMAQLLKQDFTGAANAFERYLALAPDAPDAAEKKILVDECRKMAAPATGS